MKKLFKKGLIALTLMLGMTFAVPQDANATGWRGEYRNQDNTVLHVWDVESFKGVTDIIFFRDGSTLYIFEDGTWLWH